LKLNYCHVIIIDEMAKELLPQSATQNRKDAGRKKLSGRQSFAQNHKSDEGQHPILPNMSGKY